MFLLLFFFCCIGFSCFSAEFDIKQIIQECGFASCSKIKNLNDLEIEINNVKDVCLNLQGLTVQECPKKELTILVNSLYQSFLEDIRELVGRAERFDVTFLEAQGYIQTIEAQKKQIMQLKEENSLLQVKLNDAQAYCMMEIKKNAQNIIEAEKRQKEYSDRLFESYRLSAEGGASSSLTAEQLDTSNKQMYQNMQYLVFGSVGAVFFIVYVLPELARRGLAFIRA